jgi:hypothetical protein
MRSIGLAVLAALVPLSADAGEMSNCHKPMITALQQITRVPPALGHDKVLLAGMGSMFLATIACRKRFEWRHPSALRVQRAANLARRAMQHGH